VLSLRLVTMAFIPLARKDASIINSSTRIAHLFPSPGYRSYAATRLAGSKFVIYVAGSSLELRVQDVHPGQVTRKEMTGRAKGD
jgi:NADP-dependent 3-hydroxy acid dehydrogenase YdfG